MTAAQRKPTKGKGKIPRSQARMAAVQALYQMDLAGTDVVDVIAEFTEHHFVKLKAAQVEEADPDEQNTGLERADATFFAELLHGVVRRQLDIDPLVDQQLATGWRLVRVDSILRAILRAGVLEFFERSDVPARVIINEYINVARAFFDEDEPKVVNGVLDRIARLIRPAEFEPMPA
jgi:transcription antitermination protein NusB